MMKLRLLHICDLAPPVQAASSTTTPRSSSSDVSVHAASEDSNMMRMLLLAILCMVLITEYSGGKIDGVYVVVEIFHSINVCKAKLEIKTLFVASSRSILPMPMQCMHHAPRQEFTNARICS